MRRPFLFLIALVFILAACKKELSVENGAASIGALQGSGGECLPKTVGGNYNVGQALVGDSNFIEVTVTVLQPGRYTINTDTLNGYFFSASGNFTAVGESRVKLRGSGRPIAVGQDIFEVRYDSTFCSVPITVGSGGSSGGTSVFTVGAGGTCMNHTVNGTYTQGTALGATNTVILTVNVTTPGTWTLNTASIGGISFSGSGTFASAGTQTITLTGSGTPTAAGSLVVPVAAGSSSCSFPVTVTGGTGQPGPTDYFPLTANSWWSYDEPQLAPDTLKQYSTPNSVTLGGASYRVFIDSLDGEPVDTLYYRKAGSDYFEYTYTDKYSAVTFDNESRNAILFLKEGQTTGATWNSAEFSGQVSGQAVRIRYAFTLENANETVTIGTRTFTNVYRVVMRGQFAVGPAPFTPDGTLWTFYYARGIGLIRQRLEFNGTGVLDLQIRNWRVL
jgi:hypothetical protein